ncbi:MAG: hypothetical protein DRR16_32360 [Candidatus Parabeggiatoa sp. nov. 3]|nr:MAG: hypothetical protein DRQ99_32380 [Gammaproteobacteria bacterium]RKZ74189.1 MAG: hypothetical protein DRR16_32360 [Gammaproteobacteria bacterium]
MNENGFLSQKFNIRLASILYSLIFNNLTFSELLTELLKLSTLVLKSAPQKNKSLFFNKKILRKRC